MFGLVNLKPSFWDKHRRIAAPGASEYLFNYRRIWRLSILLTGVVALVPLIFITLVDYNFTEHAMVSEWLLRTSRTVSNTRRAISFFLTERRSALDFIVHDNGAEVLSRPARLAAILENLKRSFGGGFVDLGLIDATGQQRAYVGPYGLKDKDYSGQPWFEQVIDRGVYTSDVFLGYRNVPHLVISVKQSLPDGSFDVLRSSIAIEPFEDLLSNLELGGLGDAFIINHQGILQTNSHYHGQVLEKIPLPVPEFSATTEVFEGKNPAGEAVFIGYRFIEDTPFILMIVKKKNELMKQWHKTRLELIIFLLVSVSFILAVIIGTVTFMVNKVYIADERRLMALHQMEYSNKMASIGRMAASVAHEINNPLAIINEKAGLIKDLFTIKKQYADDPKLRGLVDSTLNSVKRAGKITKRLLTFARNLEATIEPVNLGETIDEVLSFLSKEAEYRSLEIRVEVPPDIPIVESDRGKLEQIFLNIINNAFAAMCEGGHLSIAVNRAGPEAVEIKFRDDGCGIPREDLQRIFEPFFSTKTGQGGTGLGLSITYNLAREIGGHINVDSEMGQGTCFTVTLPVKPPQTKEGADACACYS
ncbi:MAG: ATP-binding protein [Desulfobacterales bacterium]